MFSLRVHIVPVGFEVDRIVLPVISMKADKVWLITEKDSTVDSAKPYLDKAVAELNKRKIPYVVEKCSIRDLFDILKVYRRIIEAERANHVFINVSTGTKIEAIAGMMACMMFKSVHHRIQPYYVEPEDYTVKPKKGQPLSVGCKAVFPLPDYKIERPEERLIHALVLVSEKGKISKKDLIQKCVEEDLINIKPEAKNQEVAKYSALNKTIITPLLSWKFIEVSGSGKRGRIIITEEGLNALKFLS